MKLIKYLIHELSTDRKIVTIEDTETGHLTDNDLDELSKQDNIKEIDKDLGELIKYSNPKLITVYNISNTGGKLVQGLNDLDTYCKKNNKEAWLECYIEGNNELSPDSICYASNKNVRLHCNKCGTDRTLRLNTYIGEEHSCVCQASTVPYCIQGVNDLYTYCKKNGLEYLIDEYDSNVDIHSISYGTHRKIQWKCEYGHKWMAAPSVRIIKGTGCPYCKGSQTSRAERTICNWLKENNINIIEREKIQGEEFDIHIVDYNILIEINSDATHISEKQREKDARKHKIAESFGYKFIVIMQSCYSTFNEDLYYDILFKYNSVRDIDNLIEKLKIKLNTLGVDIDSNVSNKAKALANKNSVPYERSIAGVYNGIEKIWGSSNIVTPDRLYASTRQYIYLTCWKCKQEYRLRGDAIKQSWNKETKGCPYCYGKRVLKGYNDLLSQEPEISLDWSSLNEIGPDEVVVHSNKIVYWDCHICGNKWRASVASRTGSNRTGCPSCNKGIALYNAEFNNTAESNNDIVEYDF